MPKRTKKKGGAANNAKVREYTDKINNYIQHCKRLQLLYDKKHNEVRTLTNYLLEIDRDFPNVPVNHQIVGEIIRAIDNLPEMDTVSQELTNLDELQNRLMVQASDNRRVIYKKINELRSSSGKTRVATPVDITVPPRPAPGLTAPVSQPRPAPGLTAPVLPPVPGSLLGNLSNKKGGPPPTGFTVPHPSANIGLPGKQSNNKVSPIIPSPTNQSQVLPPSGVNVPPTQSYQGQFHFPEFFFNMEKKETFNIKDYENHLESNGFDTFNYIQGGNTNLFLMTYYNYAINDNTPDDQIILYLNHVIRIIENVKIFENSIIRLCQSHKRSIENYTEVLKIPFEKEVNRDYKSDKSIYYGNLIRRTSELFGYLLKLKFSISDTYFYYQYIWFFLQILKSVSPSEYTSKIELSEEEIDLINNINPEILNKVFYSYIGFPDNYNINTKDLLKDESLSRSVILNYFMHLLQDTVLPEKKKISVPLVINPESKRKEPVKSKGSAPALSAELKKITSRPQGNKKTRSV